MGLKDNVSIWWDLLDFNDIRKLSNEAYEQLFLNKWSRVG
jgi:hypothetical protein